MEYDNCRVAMGMITEIFDTETAKERTAKTVPTCVLHTDFNMSFQYHKILNLAVWTSLQMDAYTTA